MLNRIDELRKEKDRADFRQRIAQTKAEVSDGLKKLMSAQGQRLWTDR